MSQQTTEHSSALTDQLLWKKLQEWLTWQAEGPVSDEMKAISHCPSGAHIRSVGKQELSCSSWEWINVNRHSRKSCRTQIINHRRHKADKPGFIYAGGWCLLPFFVTGWSREVSFNRYQRQDLVWHTKHFQVPWKGTRLTPVKQLSHSVLAIPGKHSIW